MSYVLSSIDKITNTKPQRLNIVCNESEVFRHESSSMSPTETKPELQGRVYLTF